MKTKITNILATTGISLVVLSLIGMAYGAQFLFISSVLEALGANIVIHLGFLVTQKFESKYIFLDSILDIGYMVIVLIIFGAVFDWYGSTPIWLLAIMAVVIYCIGLLINVTRARVEIKQINQLIEKRNN